MHILTVSIYYKYKRLVISSYIKNMESIEFRRKGVDCSARVYARHDFVRGNDTNVVSVSASGAMNLEQAQAYLAMVQEAVAHLESLNN